MDYADILRDASGVMREFIFAGFFTSAFDKRGEPWEASGFDRTAYAITDAFAETMFEDGDFLSILQIREICRERGERHVEPQNRFESVQIRNRMHSPHPRTSPTRKNSWTLRIRNAEDQSRFNSNFDESRLSFSDAICIPLLFDDFTILVRFEHPSFGDCAIVLYFHPRENDESAVNFSEESAEVQVFGDTVETE